MRNIYLLWVKKTSQVNKLFCSRIVRLFCGFFSKLQSIFFFQFQTLISRSVFFFKFQLPTLHLSFELTVPYLFFFQFQTSISHRWSCQTSMSILLLCFFNLNFLCLSQVYFVLEILCQIRCRSSNLLIDKCD